MPKEIFHSDQRYERIFETDDKHITNSVAVCGMTRFALFQRYVDTAPEGETLAQWLTYEFPKPKMDPHFIPEYTTGGDVIELFGDQRVDGAIDEANLVINAISAMADQENSLTLIKHEEVHVKK